MAKYEIISYRKPSPIIELFSIKIKKWYGKKIIKNYLIRSRDLFEISITGKIINDKFSAKKEEEIKNILRKHLREKTEKEARKNLIRRVEIECEKYFEKPIPDGPHNYRKNSNGD